MKNHRLLLAGLALALTHPQLALAATNQQPLPHPADRPSTMRLDLGVRPDFLVNDMDESPLKKELQQCRDQTVHRTDFSIAHRGAPLQFPEHTRESYLAAARMGAGIIECDVTFTKDRQLVCRHSQCDLHTTTNILAIPELAGKCSVPFTPAVKDPATGATIQKAQALCCTSDLTLDEFKQLKGKMDASNPDASTLAEYMASTPGFRTDLYAEHGTLMTHRESIELFKDLGVKMTPELKEAEVAMPFEGDYSQEEYAQQMIDEYRAAGVPADQVFAQSFQLQDILYWINHEPEFGKQAVFLDDRYEDEQFSSDDPATWSPTMEELAAQGVNILAPPIPLLLTLDRDGRIIPSAYAVQAKAAGLDLITWSLERSGFLSQGGGFYYNTITAAIDRDGDMLEVVDILSRQVGVRAIFSDWPATVTYYANCMGR